MAFKNNGTLNFDIKEDGINECIDEKGSMAVMLREVAWNGKEHKLELRKWVIDVDKETPMRGTSFLTENGPHNLTEILAKNGYGKTENILKNIKDRDDFEESLVFVIGKEKVVKAKNSVSIKKEDYFDPKDLI